MQGITHIPALLSPEVILRCKAAIAICNTFLLHAQMLPQKGQHVIASVKGCQVSVGHYLHSLERFPEAATAYKAAAAACAPACAPSGARRAAELYWGLALLGTGASADLEAACGLLHQRTDLESGDSMSQVTL